MFKLIIAGGREFNDYILAKSSFEDCVDEFGFAKDNIEIVSGGARGADKIGERIAAEYKLPCKIFKAEWDLYGKSAGYRRNAEMAEYASGLLAFWDGLSRGTKHMINLANKKGLKVKVVRY